MRDTKYRPRGHVIADLSTNHVERAALLCGYSVQRIQADYGIDLLVYTYDKKGYAESGMIPFQLKATDNLQVLADGNRIPVQIDQRDLNRWQKEIYPFILVMYDAAENIAYWIHIQTFLRENPGLDRNQASHTVYLSKQNRLNESAMRQFAIDKQAVIESNQGGLRHDA
jgi:Domain of unknown function (DUF4365)